MSIDGSHHSGLYERLRGEIAGIQLVDAHDHLPTEAQWLAQSGNLLDFARYARGEASSAGMPANALVPGMSMEAQWERMRPYWRHVRNTGAGLLCRRALSMFCDVDDLSDATLPIIQERLEEIRRPGVYKRLLKDEYRIAVSVNHNFASPPTKPSYSEFFAPLFYTSNFTMVQKRSDFQELQQATGIEIYSLKTYLQALDAALEEAVVKGVVGIKWHKLAYLRDMDYPREGAHAAEACLDRIFRMPAAGGITGDTPVGFDQMAPFQNYVQNHLVQRSIELDLPMQIHTGTMGGSYGAQIRHTNPTHLVDLFLHYPQARFDLLHASYPYMRELTAIVKLFANVKINTAWFDILSPRAAKMWLREWITSVPTNKVFAFGADQHSVILACAYAELVRDNMAEALAEQVVEGNLSEEQALEVAVSMLRENAWEHFQLGERWASRYGLS